MASTMGRRECYSEISKNTKKFCCYGNLQQSSSFVPDQKVAIKRTSQEHIHRLGNIYQSHHPICMSLLDSQLSARLNIPCLQFNAKQQTHY